MTVDELIDGWEAAWSGKDAGAFEPLCAPGVHYEDPLTGEPLEGIDAVARHAERLWAAFPDARLERTGARLTDGRFVAAPSKLLGTHRAALEGLPPTNRFVVVHCIWYCELRAERLLRIRGVLRRVRRRDAAGGAAGAWDDGGEGAADAAGVWAAGGPGVARSGFPRPERQRHL